MNRVLPHICGTHPDIACPACAECERLGLEMSIGCSRCDGLSLELRAKDAEITRLRASLDTIHRCAKERFDEPANAETYQEAMRLASHRYGDLSFIRDTAHTVLSSAPAAQEPRGIYVASRTKHAERWRTWRDGGGAPINSTWIDEAGPHQTRDCGELWQRCVREVASAKAFVLLQEGDDVLKGALVELGAALYVGIPIFAVVEDEARVGCVLKHPSIQRCVSVAEAMQKACAVKPAPR